MRSTAVEATAEQGTGTIGGQKIDLQGNWKSGGRQYEAKYSGSFVRRSAKLKGTQTWTDGGKTVTRACAGAIERPLEGIPSARQEVGGGAVRPRSPCRRRSR